MTEIVREQYAIYNYLNPRWASNPHAKPEVCSGVVLTMSDDKQWFHPYTGEAPVVVNGVSAIYRDKGRWTQ